MALKDIVSVNIVRQTAALTRVGFGTLAFVYDATSAASARVLSFGSPTEIDASSLPTAAKAALNAAFSGDLRPDRVKAIYRLADQVDPEDNETLTQALVAAEAVDEDWYCVTIQSRASADILEVAEWIESRDKIFVAASADADILDPLEDQDVASELLANSYSRTALIYAATAAVDWPDTAWAGPILPHDPGSITWAFRRVAGVPGAAFSASVLDALDAKRVTRVETIVGITRTIGGFTSDAGAFVDLIRGIDWLKQRMAEDMFARLVNSNKIPYTDAGIAIVESVVRARLQNAVENNVIADDEYLTVTVPAALDTDPDDRANRILRDVEFTARMAGAIHKVLISGTVVI